MKIRIVFEWSGKRLQEVWVGAVQTKEVILQMSSIITSLKVRLLDILKKVSTVEKPIIIQKTLPYFDADYSWLCFSIFPLLKEKEAIERIREQMLGDPWFSEVTKKGGFFNIKMSSIFWSDSLKNFTVPQFAKKKFTKIIEFSSPNSNKPLHLGHLRNHCLGEALAALSKKVGNRTYKVSLINDRGIHIAKSMYAYQKWGNGKSPESQGIKSDHFVGQHYLLFEQAYKKEKEKESSLIIKGAQLLLRKWEEGDEETVALWKKMNKWTIIGFEETYKRTGVSFHKTYLESETYKIGKAIIEDGLKRDVFYKKADGSIWIDLEQEKLGEKLLLRKDGTSVYITQELGTIVQRMKDFNFDKHIYVVGNEQEYHFKVFFTILKRLGKTYSHLLEQISYGMVELPDGKMRSREGNVVNADSLLDEMELLAQNSGKNLDFMGKAEAKRLYKQIGIGAVKYFLLQIDPQKNFVFNRKESLNLHGKSATFIQYSYVRIYSLLEKCKNDFGKSFTFLECWHENEKDVIQHLLDYKGLIERAEKENKPSLLATFAYQLAQSYNRFYTKLPCLKAELSVQKKRILISQHVKNVLKDCMGILGIELPQKM